MCKVDLAIDIYFALTSLDILSINLYGLYISCFKNANQIM